MRSNWFSRAHPATGGLLLPGRRGAADLLLRADGVSVVLGKRGIELEWAGFPQRWNISYVVSGRGGSSGVSVAVRKDPPPALRAMRRRSIGVWFRWFPFIFTEDDAVRVGGSTFGLVSDRERATLYTLCQVLAQREEWRSRLADPARMTQLARDLEHGALLRHDLPMGVRRTTIEVVIAMKGLGLVHRYGGRPLPCDPVPVVAATVEAVRLRIAASPYAVGVDISDADINAVLQRHYFGVQPWPFAALVC